MSELKEKIKDIFSRVDIAANGQISTSYWSDADNNLSAMSAEVISMLSSGKYKHDCSKIVGVIIKALKDNS